MTGEGESPHPVSFVGKTVDDKWVLRERLGAGGMAPVFRAERKSVPIVRAVKILPPMKVGTVFEDRFFDEIRATATIDHKNVIRIDDFGVCRQLDPKGVLFYVMEWVAGRNVKELMDGHPLDPRQALEIAAGVACGLAAAHAADPPVLHRDIKPENIMIEDGTGRVVVLDFGIAKFRRTDAEGREVQPLTQRKEIWSTPKYMSPEQATGNDELTVVTDIYSLGVVLYEMLTGEPPFDGVDRHALKAQHIGEIPVPPHKRNGAVDPRMSKFVLWMLAKRPGERPPTAEAVSRSIDKLVGRTPSGPVRKKPPSRRSPSGRKAPVSRESGVTVVGDDEEAFCGCVPPESLPLRLFTATLKGPAQTAVYELRSEHVVIGRAPDASGSGVEHTITTEDPGDLVSRRHAALHRQGNRIVLYDLGSINRTEVNGVVVDEPTPIRIGDHVVLGTAVLAALGERSKDISEYLQFCKDHHANEAGASFCSQCGTAIGVRERQRGGFR